MSLLDRVRSSASATRDTVDALRVRPFTASGWAAGAVAVAVPWLATVALAVFVWAVTPGSDTPWGHVVGIGSAGWFLGTGGAIAVDGVVVGIVPLLVWGLAAWFTAYQLRRLVVHTGQVPRALLPGFFGGYAAAAVFVGLVTLGGPARPTLSGLLGVCSVPVVAAACVLGQSDEELVERLPTWAVRAWRPALWGLAALAGLAAALVLVMMVVRWPTVSSVHAAVGAHGLSGLGLILGQAVFVPDLVVWALSFIAGPGVQVSAGGSVTVSGAAPGLLPMIPVLGVVPSEGQYPAWLAGVLLGPVAVGALVAWQSGRQWSLLARWRDKARTVAAAVLAVDIVVLDGAWLSSGSLGSGRLSHVGPDPWAVAGAVLLELGLGAGLALTWERVGRRWLR
ncbi:MAG: hypothetical protein IPF90_15825 [Actinomycetales bacterium]|nr:hypothetical protein [Candidatus Phosphoribacter baldrii]